MTDFKTTEDKVRHFWDSQDIFAKSLAQRDGKARKHFVFFEGPPTANGMPHIGHFLTRVYKDLYGRYKTMTGHYVLRKAGWDTHGLPVELEVEKTLGFKNKKDIEAYGVAPFNKKAKESVWKYKGEWEAMTKRMGFWLDLKHPYVTYETPYIESVWSILKEVSKKKLLYQAHRVVPFCTRCGTSLSSHEVAQGYKSVTDTSLFIKFKLKDRAIKKFKLGKKAYILAWTTTPWTLPGNVALAVGKKIDYIIAAKDTQPGSADDGDQYIVAKDLAEKVLGAGYQVLGEVKGKDLVGLAYEPLFAVKALKSPKAYKVYDADFVTISDGTGVVHTAVMYGEDDYQLGTKAGLPKVHTVDEAGKFTGVSGELDGRWVKSKETEETILKALEEQGNLFATLPYEHEYPFCWRCHTPLLYYAKGSWFIKMSAVNKQLLKNNATVNWIPSHIGEGRFGQWIKEGKDWALSRERYWGTPLPVWQCDKKTCGEHLVVGSLDDLEKYRYTKKNTYYILRHGYTPRNLPGGKGVIINSKLDHDTYPLTDIGREQIQEVADKLKKLGGVDVIVASPFMRTKESAEIVGKTVKVKPIIDSRLSELDHGLICEGKAHSICIAPGTPHTFDTKYGDGETWAQVYERMSQVIRDLEAKHEGKTILIVSHGDPLWLLESFTRNLTPDQTVEQRLDFYLDQGELREIDLKNYPYNEEGQVDLHRPYVDQVILKCPKCKSKMHKLPELIDGWFDSGAMPYAQWHYPFENKSILKEQFPADFIVEGIDQTRGWFYTLLAVSTLLGKGTPYKNVMALGHTLDSKGKKMSKSIGNVIRPDELMDVAGIDATRWYFYTSNVPGEPMIVSIKDAQERLKGFIGTVQNCIRFYELYAQGAHPASSSDAKSLLDEWILSRLNGLIKEVTKCLEAYDPAPGARAIEKFVVEDFSNWWLRRSRRRDDALGMLRYLLLEVAKLIAPFVPYTAEDLYLRVGGQEALHKESVHLLDWSTADGKLVNADLEKSMERVRSIVTTGLAQRKDQQLKVRQPLAAVMVPGKSLESDLQNLIKDELNVKEVRYQSGEQAFDTAITPELRAEGYARELMRQIQDMRKEAGCDMKDRVYAQWYTDDHELSEAMLHWANSIKDDTVLSEFVKLKADDRPYDVQKETDLAPGKKIWLAIKK
jgi:isoleucyl-tRNA synthetase